MDRAEITQAKNAILTNTLVEAVPSRDRRLLLMIPYCLAKLLEYCISSLATIPKLTNDGESIILMNSMTVNILGGALLHDFNGIVYLLKAKAGYDV